DRDQNGVTHAERVAGITSALPVAEPITLKVIHFLGLPAKTDVFDYLQQHTVDVLLALVATTPLWRPGQLELDRLARRRQLTRARVWRHRHPDHVTQRMLAETLRMSEPPVTQRMLEPVPVDERM